VRVDFYHLTRDPVTHVLPAIAERVLASGGRLLIVAAQRDLLDRVSERLWDAGPARYLAHDYADAPDPEIQPILLASAMDSANGAKAVALVDGLWRAEALGFERTFLFFDENSIAGARIAWRDLGLVEDCERHYWKQDGGRWREGP
jgi:DNA polymerase III subunit chi